MGAIVVPQNTQPVVNHKKNKASPSIIRNKVAPSFQKTLEKASLQYPDISPASAQISSHPLSDNNYTVQKGDTLSKILDTETKKKGIKLSRQELYSMVNQVAIENQLASQDLLFPGQKINLTSMLATGEKPDSLSMPTLKTAEQNDPALELYTTVQAPIHGKITSPFGLRKHPIIGKTLHHDGIDIKQPAGTPVKPLSSGTVTFSGNDGGYGKTVEIDHGNGLTSRYAHLSKLLVREGEQVLPRQTIGLVGQTGLTTSPHLHLEIHRQNVPIDPLTVLNRRQIEGDVLVTKAQTQLRM
jgi:murein DD-endopeptidase MepM/ murein hydrolase activator NlpD